MGHDYYDKDEVFKSYMKDMANDWSDDDLIEETVEETVLGPDIRMAVERAHQSVQAS